MCVFLFGTHTTFLQKCVFGGSAGIFFFDVIPTKTDLVLQKSYKNFFYFFWVPYSFEKL